MMCAKKGIHPFGSEAQLYVDDQGIVEVHLKTRQYCGPDAYKKIRISPWCNRDWVLHNYVP